MINQYVKSESDPEACFIFRDSGFEIEVSVRTENGKHSIRNKQRITQAEEKHIRENFGKNKKVFYNKC